MPRSERISYAGRPHVVSPRKPQHNAQCSREQQRPREPMVFDHAHAILMTQPPTRLHPPYEPTCIPMRATPLVKHPSTPPQLHWRRMDPPWRKTCPKSTKARGQMRFLVKQRQPLQPRAGVSRPHFAGIISTHGEVNRRSIAYAMLRS